MRIFKKALSFLCAFILMELLFSFFLEPVTYEHFLNFDVRKIKKENKEIELAFFGDSQAIRSYYPAIFEDDMEKYIETALNEGVNQQHIVSTYYYMKDFLKRHQIRYAVVNINYEHFLNNVKEPDEAKGITFDRIRSLSGKVDYVLHQWNLKKYPNVLKSYRYRWFAKDIPLNLRRKLTKSYMNGIDVREDIHYVEKGYVTWNLAYQQGNTGTPANCTPWLEEYEDKTTLDYMEKIVELCRENNVELYFTVSPITIGRMYAIDEYNEFNLMLQEKCDELQIPFFNLNLLKENNISFDDCNFTDTEHLNDVGSIKASHFLASILNKNIMGEDCSDYFYSSFDEMVERYPQIGACDVFVKDDGSTDSKILFEAVSFGDDRITPLYCFKVSTDGGKSYSVVQEYSTESTYLLNLDKYLDWTLKVEVKPQNMVDLHHCYMEISKE